MIRILAAKFSPSVSAMTEQLNKESALFDVYISQSQRLLSERLLSSKAAEGIFLVGNTWEWCEKFASVFDLAMVYDKTTEKKVEEYCKAANIPKPSQYVLDKCCSMPETFIHYSSICNGFQCACGGEFQKCRVYILPDDVKECKKIFAEYVKKDLFKDNIENIAYCFRIFGLTEKELSERIKKPASKLVALKCETSGLNSKVTISFSPTFSKSKMNEYVNRFAKDFESYIYASRDLTLAEVAVALLGGRYRTLAVAESITGGMIASSIVGVPGASNVFYEGAVTYSVDSKCKRLGINPHFVDEFGVVSSQVAREMAYAQLQNADFSLSTTGYAGPSAEENYPVGLCYIGVGAKINGSKHVKVFKNIFGGDRNTIRNTVTETALFLLVTAITRSDFFDNI